jgi:lipopolysaccharide export system permease protein
MRLLDRYILGTIFGAVGLVMGTLLTLIALFGFIGQQDDVGTGNYGSLQVLRYVLLGLPAQFFEFLPIAALMGSLLGMGQLARNSELTVMRAAGIPVLRIGASMALAGLILAVIGLMVAEFVAPASAERAKTQRAIDRYQSISYARRGGAWVRDGNLILKAEQRTGDGLLRGITVFEMTPDNRLAGVGRADSAVERTGGGWNLKDYAASTFSAEGVATSKAETRPLETAVSSAFLSMATADPMELSMRDLRQGIAYLSANGGQTRAWEFAFWSIPARAVAIPFAVLLALPFLFGSLRSSGNGARATLGMIFGLAYYILQRMVQSGTIAFALDPLLLAWLPTVALAAIVIFLLWRLRA